LKKLSGEKKIGEFDNWSVIHTSSLNLLDDAKIAVPGNPYQGNPATASLPFKNRELALGH